MNSTNPYSPTLIEDDHSSDFVPDEVTFETLRQRTREIFQKHRKRFLRLGVIAYLYLAGHVLSFIFLHVAIAFCLLLIIPLFYIGVECYLFELIKNDHCTIRKFKKSVKRLFIFRMKFFLRVHLVVYLSIILITGIAILIMPIEPYRLIPLILVLPMTFIIMIVTSGITNNLMAPCAGLCFIDLNKNYSESMEISNLCKRAINNNKTIEKIIFHIELQIIYVLLTCTLRLPYFIPYCYCMRAVHYLLLTESYHKQIDTQFDE